MDPTNSTNTPAPQTSPPQETSSSKKSRWPFSRKVTIILGIALLVAALRKGRVVLQATVHTGAKNSSVMPEERIRMLRPILESAVSGPLKEY